MVALLTLAPDLPTYLETFGGTAVRPFQRQVTPRTTESTNPFIVCFIVLGTRTQVRLGKGGRGSLFVFTRGGPADTSLADEWKVYAAEGTR